MFETFVFWAITITTFLTLIIVIFGALSMFTRQNEIANVFDIGSEYPSWKILLLILVGTTSELFTATIISTYLKPFL